MDRCIYCDRQNNLNTQLTISLDNGDKVTVSICDEHAEDATVKTARQAYIDRQRKIEEFLEQAKALGLEVQEGSGKLAVVRPSNAVTDHAPEKPDATNKQTRQVEQHIVEERAPNSDQLKDHIIITKKEREEGWVDTSKVDSAMNEKGMRSVGGSTSFGAVQSHSSIRVEGEKDVLPSHVRRGKVKMQMVQGRGGQPIAIPGKRVDGTGTTRVRIMQGESDHQLQRRFKDMANESRHNDAGPDFRAGYNDSTRNCPLCRGECVVDDIDCPKCDGMGFISLY